MAAEPLSAVSAVGEECTGPLSERINASVTGEKFVGTEGDRWHCFAGCGSVIDFWMRWRGSDFAVAIPELAEMLMRPEKVSC